MVTKFHKLSIIISFNQIWGHLLRRYPLIIVSKCEATDAMLELVKSHIETGENSILNLINKRADVQFDMCLCCMYMGKVGFLMIQLVLSYKAHPLCRNFALSFRHANAKTASEFPFA